MICQFLTRLYATPQRTATTNGDRHSYKSNTRQRWLFRMLRTAWWLTSAFVYTWTRSSQSFSCQEHEQHTSALTSGLSSWCRRGTSNSSFSCFQRNHQFEMEKSGSCVFLPITNVLPQSDLESHVKWKMTNEQFPRSEGQNQGYTHPKSMAKTLSGLQDCRQPKKRSSIVRSCFLTEETTYYFS